MLRIIVVSCMRAIIENVIFLVILFLKIKDFDLFIAGACQQ